MTGGLIWVLLRSLFLYGKVRFCTYIHVYLYIFMCIYGLTWVLFLSVFLYGKVCFYINLNNLLYIRRLNNTSHIFTCHTFMSYSVPITLYLSLARYVSIHIFICERTYWIILSHEEYLYVNTYDHWYVLSHHMHVY